MRAQSSCRSCFQFRALKMAIFMSKLVTICLIATTLFSRGRGCVDLSDSYTHVIYVEPNNPNSANNTSCYEQNLSQQIPCADINFALAFPDRENSTKFILSSKATHKLVNNESTTVFSGGSEVAFYSDSGTAVVECEGGAGLAFINTTQITFNGVSFQQCGAWRDSTSRDFTYNTIKLLQIRVGLYFYNCANVTMVNMSVSNSTEAVGVVMYSTAGINYIAYSQFDNNRISENNKNESGGGGFAVEFNYCKPGDNSCNETNHQTENIQNTVYTFEHCSFRNNRAIDQSGSDQTDVSILPYNETHSSLGRGGGLSLYFKGNATNNKIIIDYCYFEKNHANWGGGLCVEYADHSIQNQVIVRDSKFKTNHCYFRHEETGALGGGVLVSSPVHYDFVSNKSIDRNNILFDGCNFADNRAVTGGALALVYTLQRLSHYRQLFQANIANSIFTSNQARLGSAVAVDHEYFYHQGELGNMILSDCIFYNNTIVYNDTNMPYSVGIGALYISEVSVTFQGSMEFSNNTGSALALVGTILTFAGNSTINFTGNSGGDGGAMVLVGGSRMILGEGMQIHFEANKAIRFGGAIYNIYVGKEDLRSSVKCFLQYDDPFVQPKDWKVKFKFKGNRAEYSGNSIYSSTILPCSWTQDLRAGPDTVSQIFCWNTSNWIYENSSCSNEIYTSPKTFSNHTKFSTFPGKTFHLNITAMDDLGHDVTSNTIYTALIKNSSGSNLTVTAEVDPQYTYVANGSIGITGTEGANVTLQLDVAGHRDWRIKIPVLLKKCPLGYVLKPSASSIGENESITMEQASCECIGGKNTLPFGGKLICERDSMRSKIRAGFWIGNFSNSLDLYMVESPFVMRNTTLINITDVDSQCSHLNRTGPLCGECIDNHSTAVNSYNYECVPCNSSTTNLAANIAAYVSLTYLPYLIVFAVIMIFDVRLMSGPLVGFILYAQLIGSGMVDLTVDQLPISIFDPLGMQTAYRLTYGVFNLNSFSIVMNPFCINEQFNTLDIICLDYGIAILPLLLIIGIHLLVRLRSYRLRQKKIRKVNNEPVITATKLPTKKRGGGSGLIHSIVGFIHLSYTKMCVASVFLLTTTGVLNKNGEYINSSKRVYFAGNYSFSDTPYLRSYGFIAIIVFVLVGVCLPLLLLGPLDLINWFLDKPKCKCLRRAWPSVRVNIFLEAFRSCYKSECRYFAGVYFLYRLSIFSMFAFTSCATSVVLWQLVFTILMIILVALFQPHTNKICNYIDLAMLFNIAGILILSFHLSTAPQLFDDKYPFPAYCGGLVLVWLPMVYFILYVCWLISQKTKVGQRAIYRLNLLLQRISPRLSIRKYEPERQPLLNPTARDRSQSDSDDQQLFRRAEAPNHYKPAKRRVHRVGKRQLQVHTTVVDVLGTSGTANVHSGTVHTALIRSDSSGIVSDYTN